ncbi:MAG: OmpA/MotB family protein [Pirellulales bacterium]
MAGKHGGAWKVAYADFVTAMMAFFMVMWILGQSKPVKQAVAQYFKDPYGTSSKPGGSGGTSFLQFNKPGIPTRVKQPKTRGPGRKGGAPESVQTADGTKDAPTIKRPSLFALHDGDHRSVGTLVTFAETSAALDTTANRRLKRLVPEILGKPNKIEVRGHATRRPLPPGSPFKNAWDLSYARCQAVMKFLETHGVEPDRIRLSQGGAFEPFTIGADSGQQAQNSRVEVYMLSEFAEDLVGTPEERAKRFANP